MKKIVGLLLLSLLCACALPAQTFSLISGREPVTSLDGLWRFHTGDNPAWANPNFDDSQWPLLRSDESWTKQGYPHYTGYAWYRFTIQVPDGNKPISLLLTQIFTGYRVFADGKLIGSESSTAFNRDTFASAHPEVFRLPIGGAGPQTIQIALRVWEDRRSAPYAGGGPQAPGNVMGNSTLLRQRLQQQRDVAALTYVSDYAYCLLEALVGLTILALFLFRREDREYLWFSVLLLADVPGIVLNLIFRLGSIRYGTYISIGWTVGALSAIAALAFFSIVLNVRRSRLWWWACIAAAASPLPAVLFYLQWARALGTSFAVNLCCLLPAYIWIVVALAICAFRKDVSARLLLAPAMLFYGFGIVSDVAQISWIFGWQKRVRRLELVLVRHPLPLDLRDVINYIFVLALLIFLVRRFALARQKEAWLSTEIEAARSVQSLLIPATAPSTPGFQVESVYLPASEVGGDFFHVQPGEDGSLLIVVGDVSGKGLKAAMTVSTIVGALRNEASREPAQVLANLNRVLHGQITGFATCCAARISADGVMTIANAGHIPPYRNGGEMTVQGGLPLGIVEEGKYEETQFEVAVGERLTFVSDGVVEATNEKKELFGFGRVQAISDQPAHDIAAAAQNFGQEDDISVLSVTRTMNLKAAHA